MLRALRFIPSFPPPCLLGCLLSVLILQVQNWALMFLPDTCLSLTLLRPSSQPFHSTKYFTKLQSNLACSLKPMSSHWQIGREPAFTNIWNTCTSCQLASGCTLAQQWLLWGVPHWSMLLTSLTSISVTVIPVEPKAEDVPVSNPYLTS